MTGTARPTPATRITVRRGVIGLLERDDHLLMIQRALHVPKGGTWCFPGGHLEPGENARMAVVREMYEELGITVAPTVRLGAVRIERRYVLGVWGVKFVSGEIRASDQEVADYRWVPVHEVRKIAPGLPSNEIVAEMIERRNGAPSRGR